MSILIRPSTQADLAAITAIYRHYVQGSAATFEIDPPGEDEMARRRNALLAKGLPWLVAETQGQVAGYAYAGPYRTRPAYDWTVEDSIYVAPTALGQGIGRALLDELITRCAGLGYRQMVAVIGDSANAGSQAVHRACGFATVGVLNAVGWKFGRWIDCVLMQRPLGSGAAEPVKS